MNGSYIKLSCSINEWEWAEDHRMFRFWIYLLTNAAQSQVHYKGTLLLPGQLLVSRKRLANDCAISEQNVRTFLRRLETNQQINQQNTNKFSLITIVNWGLYQSDNSDTEKKSTSKLTSKQPANKENKEKEKNQKKEKEKKEKKNPPKGGQKEKNRTMIPEWISFEVWNDFVEMRERIGKPMTAIAEDRAIEKLKKLRNEGDDPNEVLQNSIRNRWQGLFPSKRKKEKEPIGSQIATRSYRGEKKGTWSAYECDLSEITESYLQKKSGEFD